MYTTLDVYVAITHVAIDTVDEADKPEWLDKLMTRLQSLTA